MTNAISTPGTLVRQTPVAPSPRSLADAPSAAPSHLVCDDHVLLAPWRHPAPSAARAALSAALAPPARGIKRATARATRAVAPLLPYLVAAGTVACLVGVARGYACTGYDADATQNFSNANDTIFGYIHGWFSDCYDYSYPCGSSCSGTPPSCSTTMCEATASDEAPSHYVSAATQAVQKCGFDLVNSIPAGAATRIANGLIEKKLWVKLVVNTLNLTDVTDPSIICLHAIA